MVNKKYFGLISLSLIILALFSCFVSADMMPQGAKSVNYCFTIENQAEYSDYVFLRYGYPFPRGEIIPTGSCSNFYKFSNVKIYVIKAENFELEELEELQKPVEIKVPPESQPVIREDYTIEEKSYQEKAQEKVQKLKEYFDNNPQMLVSSLELKNYGLVSKYDPLKKAEEVLKISLLTDDSFILEKGKMIYTYEDGTVEEKAFTGNSFPQPSRTTILPIWTDYALILGGIALTVIALIVILIIIIVKIKNKF